MSGLDEAYRALGAARLLARGGFHAEAVSRAYYAMFYAARAAVHAEGSEPKTHTGVASEFSRLYVRTGRVPAAVAKLLRQYAGERADADYEGLDLTADEAGEALASAETFIRAVGAVLRLAPPRPLTAGMTDDQKRDMVAQLTREMDAAAEALEFEKAAEIRDSIAQIEADLAA